jgi:uncharacterized protein involved in exopolysaccharide biosynthesis
MGPERGQMNMIKEPELKDYLNIVIKWRDQIVAFVSLVVVLTVLLCMIVPWTYRAETTILLPQQSGQALQGVMALSSMMSGSSINMPSEISQSLVARNSNYGDILRSNTLSRMIIEGLDLKKYYPGRSKESLVQMIKKGIKVREQKGILKISFISRDRKLSADIANYSVLALDEFNKKGNVQYARRMKNFISEQLVTAKVDLSEAEESLKKFETQSQMVKMSEKELMLSRLLRDVKIKEAVYTMLLQEYEKSKIDEAKEELFFEVLDTATAPNRPYTPRPLLYAILSAILALMFAVSIAFTFEYFEGQGVKFNFPDLRQEIKWLKR